MIVESSSTPSGTHPSHACHLTVVRCDDCGDDFEATANIDGIWYYHEEPVGEAFEGSDYCLRCAY